MWPEQQRSGHISFPESFVRRVLTLCANGARSARGSQRRPRRRLRNVRRVRSAARRVARVCTSCHCATRISSPETINVHAMPTSESGSRATKLLVTMLTTSPRRSPDVIVHSSMTASSRSSAQMMNASYVPSLSVVMSVTRVDTRELRAVVMRVFAHPTILTQRAQRVVDVTRVG